MTVAIQTRKTTQIDKYEYFADKKTKDDGSLNGLFKVSKLFSKCIKRVPKHPETKKVPGLQ